MSLVPIQIGDLTLHFRKLTFMEEFAVVYPEDLTLGASISCMPWMA